MNDEDNTLDVMPEWVPSDTEVTIDEDDLPTLQEIALPAEDLDPTTKTVRPSYRRITP